MSACRSGLLSCRHAQLIAGARVFTGRGLINREAIVLDEKARSDFAELRRQSRDPNMTRISPRNFWKDD
ncbi:MAG: hypothetical protein E5V70_01285 [Mesorhizobium sp.]|nr:MAG: hypothetical protein E5V70_01285 [Mesorhizobium sp.]